MDQQRLPPQLEHLTDPDFWADDITKAFWEHILSGQKGGLAHDELFQYKHLSVDVDDTDLRHDIHPKSILRYDAESRLFVTRLLRNSPNDMLVQHELLNQLPRITDEHYIPLNDEQLSDALGYTSHGPLRELIECLMDYEVAGPVHVSCHDGRGLY